MIAEIETLLERVQSVDDEVRELSAQLRDDDDDDPPSGGACTSDGLETGRVLATPKGRPKPKAQRNFTDSDSRIMVANGMFLQGYNWQLAVDEGNQIIVGQSVTNQSANNNHLMPMVEQVVENCGQAPEAVTVDAGYWRPTHAGNCRRLGVDAYISQQRRTSAEASADPAWQSMEKKLASATGKQTYARRKAVVAPVNGQMKQARGFRRFHLRGLTNVGAEWSLVSACHNRPHSSNGYKTPAQRRENGLKSFGPKWGIKHDHQPRRLSA